MPLAISTAKFNGAHTFGQLTILFFKHELKQSCKVGIYTCIDNNIYTYTYLY